MEGLRVGAGSGVILAVTERPRSGVSFSGSPLAGNSRRMTGTHDTTNGLGILLLVSDSGLRKLLRRHLEREGHPVLAVGSIGDAIARLRSRHYPLVLCASGHQGAAMAEDYALLIDSRGMLARTGAFELFLPGIGIDARGVLLVPVAEPGRVSDFVRQAAERLGLLPAVATAR